MLRPSHEARCPFGPTFFLPPAELDELFTEEFTLWNPVAMPKPGEIAERLNTLHSNPVGALLIVSRHWLLVSNTFGPPVLQVVAAPVVATYAKSEVSWQECCSMKLWPFNQQTCWSLLYPVSVGVARNAPRGYLYNRVLA